MSKEINNDCTFARTAVVASTAIDDGYHAQHRLKEATMTTTGIRRRRLAAFMVACICAFAAVTLAQSADPSSEQGTAREPSSNMPLIAPIEVGMGKYVDLTASSQGPTIDEKAAPIFVKRIPPGYRDWRLISVAHQEGSLNDIRAILGNDKAIKAYRERKLPFPDGTIIARLAWSHDASEENNKVFGRPQSFGAGGPKNGVQFMVKDSKKYASTGGWGFAHFDDGKPADEAVLNTCFPCHAALKERDLVFTRYAP
jgi:hypothetical protein